MKTKINHFLDTLDRAPRTVDAYRYGLQRFMLIVGEDAQLNTETYEKFLAAIKDLSPSTKQIWRSAVLGFYSFFKAGNLTEMNGITKHYTRNQGKRVANFNREAIEQVIQYCSQLNGDLIALRDRAFVLTLTDTGLRISEACALKRGEIDWQEARALIVGKGDKQAVIRFSERSIQAMREYHVACALIEPNTRLSLKSQPVFARHDIRASKKIKPIKANGMWQAIKDRVEEAGIERALVRIHDFRHYFVTISYLAKGNLKLSQELARHSSIDTTNRYAHFGGEADIAYDEIFNKRK